ncbi:hypothetical protein [Campylobacter sp. RM16190]|uniref:hypothetical protein n=1 Tax=Campylobacter sp. RM16190 TaxID=1705727 RepID=UPI0014738CA9|nr:hypothetical protein [Campylobacter sp. RM16190]
MLGRIFTGALLIAVGYGIGRYVAEGEFGDFDIFSDEDKRSKVSILEEDDEIIENS